MPLRQVIGGCLVSGLLASLPVAAQTGRIAHFSHGGSAATLVAAQAAADNFGDPQPYFIPDSIRYLSNKMALSYGRWHWGGNGGTTDTLRFPESYSPQQAARYTRQLYTRARLLGFDSVGNPHKSIPVLKQPKGKQKKKAASSGGPQLPAAPMLPVGALVVGALAGVGWLLGGKTQLRLPRNA